MKGVGAGNLPSTEKEKSIQNFASRTSLHSLLQNYISSTMQFITSKEEANAKEKNIELKIVRLPQNLYSPVLHFEAIRASYHVVRSAIRQIFHEFLIFCSAECNKANILRVSHFLQTHFTSL